MEAVTGAQVQTLFGGKAGMDDAMAMGFLEAAVDRTGKAPRRLVEGGIAYGMQGHLQLMVVGLEAEFLHLLVR